MDIPPPMQAKINAVSNDVAGRVFFIVVSDLGDLARIVLVSNSFRK